MTTSSSSVSITSRHTVHCDNEVSWTALDSPFRLGALDQVAGFVPIQVVWVYKQSTNIQLIPVERLQRAMTLLLDYYPQLTGRLRTNASDGTREITRLGTGAELLVAQCSEPLDAFSSPGVSSPESRRILMQNLPAAGNALLAQFDPTPEGVSRDPIFAVQHTRFACGGVALGVRIHHTVCDGDGFFQVVRDLAELYRGVLSSETSEDTVSDVFLAHPPHIRPYMSEQLAPEERLAALDFKTSLLHVDPPASIDSAADASVSSVTIFPPPPFPVVGRFLRFSSRELASLKEQATNPNGNAWISTFEALSAHIYQRVHKARLQLYAKDSSLGELSFTDFLTPINLRSRLGLPPRYFPNGLLTSNGIIPPDILATGQLWQVASAVHDLTRSKSLTSKDELHHTLKWIVAQSDMRQIDDNFRYGSGSFMVSQWNKFDMYAGSVFDVGPVLVSPPFTQSSLVDGLVYFLLTEELATGGDAGAIDVSLSLIKPVWDIMDQDETLLQ